jgi:tetratricopeptide (TPR) repeat protein
LEHKWLKHIHIILCVSYMHVLQGKWHNVLEFAGHYKAAAAAAAANSTATHLQQQQQQEAELTFATFKVHALMRLRRFEAAAAELAQLGQACWVLPGQQQQQQQRQQEPAAAAVPFGLLYLRAQLPACRDDSSSSSSIDLLHELRCYCQQQLQQHQQQQRSSWKHTPTLDMQADAAVRQLDQQQQRSDTDSTPSAAAAAAAAAANALWGHRLCGVTCSLVLHYWQAGAVAAALRLLDEQLLLQPTDCQLWSLAGRLLLQLNVMKQAHRCFTEVQELVQMRQQQQGGAVELVQLQQLVRHNWGCYHALNNNMTVALHEFESAQQLAAAAAASKLDSPDSTDTPQQSAAAAAEFAASLLPSVDGVSLANSAVCLLHMGQLTEAISCLEAGLQQHPAHVAKV